MAVFVLRLTVTGRSEDVLVLGLRRVLNGVQGTPGNSPATICHCSLSLVEGGSLSLMPLLLLPLLWVFQLELRRRSNSIEMQFKLKIIDAPWLLLLLLLVKLSGCTAL